jgi:hypothetical protein
MDLAYRDKVVNCLVRFLVLRWLTVLHVFVLDRGAEQKKSSSVPEFMWDEFPNREAAAFAWR